MELNNNKQHNNAIDSPHQLEFPELLFPPAEEIFSPSTHSEDQINAVGEQGWLPAAPVLSQPSAALPQPRKNRALSASRAKDFKQCPLLYRFRAIDKLPEPVSLAQRIGTCVHYSLEKLYQLAAHERTSTAALSLARSYWQENTTPWHLDDQYTEKTAQQQDFAEVESKIATLIENYFAMENPQKTQPYKLEHFIDITVNETPLRGIVDRIDRLTSGEMVITDYKTGKAPHPNYTADALYQMKFYAVLLWNSNMGFPQNLRLLYLADKTIVDYAPDPVGTKNFTQQLTALWRKIDELTHTGEFLPHRSRLCQWCTHQKNCPEFGGHPPPYPDTIVN